MNELPLLHYLLLLYAFASSLTLNEGCNQILYRFIEITFFQKSFQYGVSHPHHKYCCIVQTANLRKKILDTIVLQFLSH